jgi:hypothetical protein
MALNTNALTANSFFLHKFEISFSYNNCQFHKPMGYCKNSKLRHLSVKRATSSLDCLASTPTTLLFCVTDVKCSYLHSYCDLSPELTVSTKKTVIV